MTSEWDRERMGRDLNEHPRLVKGKGNLVQHDPDIQRFQRKKPEERPKPKVREIKVVVDKILPEPANKPVENNDQI